MSKTPTLADRYADPCDFCGKDLSRTSCRNVHCSYNANHWIAEARDFPGHRYTKPTQGPGKRKVRPVEAMRKLIQRQRAEALHWDTARKTGRWSWPM